MSKVNTMKVRRSFKTQDENGNEVTKNRWPAIGRQVVGADGKTTLHLDFMPKATSEGEIEPLFVFNETNGASNDKE